MNMKRVFRSCSLLIFVALFVQVKVNAFAPNIGTVNVALAPRQLSSFPDCIHKATRCTTLEAVNKKTDFSPIFSSDVSGERRSSKSSDDSTNSGLFGLSEEWVARLILVTVSAFYGTNFGCVKILNEALSPSLAAGLRFSLAALVFLPNLLRVMKSNPKLIMGGVEVGIYSFLGYWAQATALETTSASKAAFICSLAVIVVPIVDAIFGDKNQEVPFAHKMLPAILAATGVGCLELGGTTLPEVGDLWACLQPLFFGFSFWRIESHMKSSQKQGEARAFTGAMMMTVALSSLIWATHDSIGASSINGNLLHTLPTLLSDWKVALAIAWTGLVTTALTSYGENIAMKRLSASESTIIYSTEPLWGTAFAAFALGEEVGLNTAIGAFLILLACAWSSLGPSFFIAAGLTSGAGAEVFAEGVEEVAENVGVNFSEIIENWFMRNIGGGDF